MLHKGKWGCKNRLKLNKQLFLGYISSTQKYIAKTHPVYFSFSLAIINISF